MLIQESILKTFISLNGVVRSIIVLFTILLTFSAARAATIVVPAGGNIQAAINTAQFGDTIVLQSGATYETPADFTPYMLTNKGSGSGYITITSSVPPPPDGTRVTLADRANMPKLVVKKGSSFLRGAARRASLPVEWIMGYEQAGRNDHAVAWHQWRRYRSPGPT